MCSKSTIFSSKAVTPNLEYFEQGLYKERETSECSGFKRKPTFIGLDFCFILGKNLCN